MKNFPIPLPIPFASLSGYFNNPYYGAMLGNESCAKFLAERLNDMLIQNQLSVLCEFSTHKNYIQLVTKSDHSRKNILEYLSKQNFVVTQRQYPGAPAPRKITSSTPKAKRPTNEEWLTVFLTIFQDPMQRKGLTYFQGKSNEHANEIAKALNAMNQWIPELNGITFQPLGNKAIFLTTSIGSVNSYPRACLWSMRSSYMRLISKLSEMIPKNALNSIVKDLMSAAYPPQLPAQPYGVYPSLTAPTYTPIYSPGNVSRSTTPRSVYIVSGNSQPGNKYK